MKEPQGTSPFAVLANDLPVRARVALTMLVGDLAADRLQSSPDIGLAHKGLSLARQWHDCKQVDLDEFANALESEKGINFAEYRARSDAEKMTWVLLSLAIYYVVHHASLEDGYDPGWNVSDVDETHLDDLDECLRKVAPEWFEIVERAAAFLKRNPKASYAQVKSHIARR